MKTFIIGIVIPLMLVIFGKDIRDIYDKVIYELKYSKYEKLEKELIRIDELCENYKLLVFDILQQILGIVIIIFEIMLIFFIEKGTTTIYTGNNFLLIVLIILFSFALILMSWRFVQFSNSIARIKNPEKYRARIKEEIEKIK